MVSSTNLTLQFCISFSRADIFAAKQAVFAGRNACLAELVTTIEPYCIIEEGTAGWAVQRFAAALG